MSKNDTKSIKYILNEMDPAEKIEFERDMENNPDLLIEVESIKSIKRKLDNLPVLTPPRHLSESVLSQAASESVREGGGMRLFLSAAVLLFGIAAGSLMMENSDQFAVQTEASVNLSSPTIGTESTDLPGQSELTPWVDRNNVLRLSGFESGSFTPASSDLNNSYMNLRPSDRFFLREPASRSLHLTGNNP